MFRNQEKLRDEISPLKIHSAVEATSASAVSCEFSLHALHTWSNMVPVNWSVQCSAGFQSELSLGHSSTVSLSSVLQVIVIAGM